MNNISLYASLQSKPAPVKFRRASIDFHGDVCYTMDDFCEGLFTVFGRAFEILRLRLGGEVTLYLEGRIM